MEMGSLGNDDNDEIKQIRTASTVDIGETEAQNFDSQFSPPHLSGERLAGGDADELQFMQSTVPFDDTVPLEDVFETQLVNVGGETQVLDDFDCIDNVNTQLIDEFDSDVIIDSDGEGTDRTEVLGDSDALSDDELIRRVGSHSMGGEKLQCDTPCQQGGREYTGVPDALNDKKHSSELHVSTPTPPDQDTPEQSCGSVRRGFTSIRAASLRASGLAARGMASKATNSGSFSILRDSQSLKQDAVEANGIPVTRDSAKVGEEVNQECDLGNYKKKVEGLRNESKGRIGSSTVRKLFTEDTLSKNEGSGNVNDTNCGAKLPQLLVCNNELAGLSYVDSQEPGESSQANALDFVEKFIQVNVVGVDREVHHGKSTGGKSNPVSCAKGAQSLAKSASHRSKVGETGIFDWDDSREDEGGGEFFCRRKEDFFDGRGHRQKFFTQPWKSRHAVSKGSRVDVSKSKEDQSKIHQKIMGLVHSDSKIMFHNSKGNDKTVSAAQREIKKNLINELDEELNHNSSAGRLDAPDTNADMPDMLNVGFDTQLAAEAMEALFHGTGLVSHDTVDKQVTQKISKGSPKGEAKKGVRSKKSSLRKRARPSDLGVLTRQSKKLKWIGANLSKEFSISPQKSSKKVRRQLDTELVKSKQKRDKLNAKNYFASNGSRNLEEMPSKMIQQRKRGALKRGELEESDRVDGTATSTGCVSVRKRDLQEYFGTFTPIAHRTRQCKMVNHLKGAENVSNDFGEEKDDLMEMRSLKGKGKSSGGGDDDIEVSNAKKRSSNVCSSHFTEPENVRKSFSSNQSRNVQNAEKSGVKQLDPKLTGMTSGLEIDTLSYPRRRRTRRSLSTQVNETGGLAGTSRLLVGQESNGQSITRQKRLKSNVKSKDVQSDMKRKTRSSAYACAVLPSLDSSTEVGLLLKNSDKPHSGDAVVNCTSADMNGIMISNDLVGAGATRHSDRKDNADFASSAGEAGKNASLEVSPRERYKPSDSACTTPVSHMTPANVASPICMGNEYFKQSCKKNLLRPLLMKEINSLCAASPKPTALKNSRRRRDITNVRVLFSHHLDEDIIKQQKKILARLGVSIASSISDATHFVTDQFVRTRNMLEAIAFGKPVVTHLWLESCGQASCFIDEKNYILRDAKKEKEFGFSMPVSLARACQHPLLEDQRVLITPNTKPGKEIIASLVRAVHGQAVERIGRSALKDDKIPDDLLVLSCEEDYAICMPFLEKGAAVYSSELLLNGIVTQKLEYERHRLFVDHVKRTRSTIWLKKDGDRFLPVTKRK